MGSVSSSSSMNERAFVLHFIILNPKQCCFKANKKKKNRVKTTSFHAILGFDSGQTSALLIYKFYVTSISFYFVY